MRIQIGTIGYRTQDGSVIKSVPIYGEPPAGVIAPTSGITAEEKEICEAMIKNLARKFKEYMSNIN